MRAGRLVSLLLLLQNGGRVTAAEMAARLGVSERTVLRDLQVLAASGLPVHGVRGPGGGFELDTFEQTVPPLPPGLTAREGQIRRVRVRLSPAALQWALVHGRPDGWRPRPQADPTPGREDWVEGSFRFSSYDGAVRELLALGPDVEILLPVELRATMAEVGRRLTRLHAGQRTSPRDGRDETPRQAEDDGVRRSVATSPGVCEPR